MTKKLKRLLLTFAVLLVLCGGVIAKLAMDNNDLKMQNQIAKNYRTQLENVYEKSFFELTDSMRNLQSSLSKLHASNGRATQQTLLTQIVSQAETAESDLGSLPIDNQSLQKTAEFANKTSDFCLSLQRKLANGGSISNSDRKTLKSLSDMSQTLATRLADMSHGIGKDIMLADGVLHKGKIDGINGGFDDINQNTFNYPEMIYDGPFSDVKKADAKVNLPYVSADEAKAKVAKQLEDFGIETLEYKGETKNKLDVYNFEVKFANGSDWYMQASQNGGMICFVSSTGCKSGSDGKTDAMQTAKEFANKLGYEVEPVWVSKESDGPTYVNLAPVVGDVIIYPDIVKVAVDDNGICGFEAQNYLANHKTRKLDKMYRDEAAARQKLAEGMTVKNVNMALTPQGEKEVLCFEYECEMDGDQYFVFIDANTFDEVDIFKVVEGTEGYTVM